ncbi:PE-PPE domain-containing protein [Mycolicibacterium pyrenivorans]|uniref:PE-PPE domain-containing protein n=1 Tax=Mycolicibacterium pyrenivorans TaxID=187102 RepID=UPI0021F3A20A|nr:PE-PPE domain-containing protein [Mycolicibacterium pyrenivorans]MCV7152888.1 PE-PPE domain-containing protein [Mycolicibacterium pyrenivorans]
MRTFLTIAAAASVTAVTSLIPQNIALTASVRTLTGYTNLGTLHWNMQKIFQGAFCEEASGSSCSTIPYPAGVPALSEPGGVLALNWVMRSASTPTTVLAFSQGASVASQWLRQNAGKEGAPDPSKVSFVLAANPERKYGGIRPDLGLRPETPGTDYPVLDVAVEYDGAADFPDNPLNLVALANAYAGFVFIHVPGYERVDLEASDKLVWVEGNTTYVLIRSEDVPLLAPLRMAGLSGLAHVLNGPVKVVIDSAYDRDYPNLVDPASADAVLHQFPAQFGPAADENPSRTDLSTSLSSKLRVSLNGAADPEVHPREPALDEDGSRAEEFSDGASGEQVDSPPSQPRNRYARQPITDLSTGEDGARSWATFGQPSTAGAVPNAEGDVGESAETPLSARASTEVTSRDRILPNRLATSDVADKSRSETSDPAGGRAAGKRGAGRSDDSSGRSFGRSFARMGSSSTSPGTSP